MLLRPFVHHLTELDLTIGSMMHFVDVNGKVLGKHKGITHYTIGQRKGLNLSMGHPVFVVDICPETNEVVIGEHEDVFTNELYAEKVNFMGVEKLDGVEEFVGKIRYAHKGEKCRVSMDGPDRIHVVFEQPVRAVTKGQAVVLYRDDYVALGGVIV